MRKHWKEIVKHTLAIVSQYVSEDTKDDQLRYFNGFSA